MDVKAGQQLEVTSTGELLDPWSGTARLQVVIPVALISFFYANMLDYALPLYLGARETAAESSGRG